MRLFVDSGAWIALPSRRDQHHHDSALLFRAAIDREIPLITTNLVLAEVHRFVLFRDGARAAATTLARIEASPLLSLEFATLVHQ